MGNWISDAWTRLFETQRELKLVIVGLDYAGKSTLLHKIRYNENKEKEEVPTVGANTEDFQIKNVNLKVFDLSGQQKMRNVWKYYYQTIEGIIFVVDSGNRERLSEAREELQGLLSNPEAADVPVLVFANKQDLPGALKLEELSEGLGLEDFKTRKNKHILLQECSAVRADEGLHKGFEWIVARIVEAGPSKQ